MTDNEYIKLNRKIMKWEWFTDQKTAHFFIYCILSANWKDGNFKGQIIKRGQFVRTLAKMSNESGLTIQNIRTAIKHLKSTGEITTQLTKNEQGTTTIITVVKYDNYQQPNIETNNDSNNRLTSDQQQTNNRLTQIEEDNNLRTKEPKNNNLLNNSDELFNCPSEPDAAEESPYKNYLTLWNSLEPYGITTIRAIRGKRLISLQARLKEYGKKSFAECIEQIKESDFLQKSNFFNFDWMVCKTNYPKVLEGKYNNDNDKGNNKQSSFNMDDFLRRYDE